MTPCLTGDGNPATFLGFCASCKLNMGEGAMMLLTSAVGTKEHRQARVVGLLREQAKRQTFRGRSVRR